MYKKVYRMYKEARYKIYKEGIGCITKVYDV